MPSFVAVAPYDTVYYFDQLIDRDGPSKGAFKRRHWHRAEFYNEDGPIILMNAGEVDASGTVPHVYFAHNAVLLQDSGDCTGSYPGGLVSWMIAAHPDIFWIVYTSSAVV
ncbi:hypothetical protein ARMGADRAFT_90233 [Armillaria gallica]|uniref:Uncharacterized protein n=1 Tax=Armillaria gallica TaxID=47427 RepID=A0A2H3DGI2_ARMGA|nr:hypothetical protein ARMGADRAFT_90233 [Armillaria gallica]